LEHQESRLVNIRSFVAVNIPDNTRKSIVELQDQLKHYQGDVRWVRAESIHITLKFLGDVIEEQIGQVAQSIQGAVSGVQPFDVCIRGVGVFPNERKPRVLWLGIQEGAEKLIKLAVRIEEGCFKLGFKKEERKYSAHLTIGRVRSFKRIASTLEAMRTVGFEGSSFRISEVDLMKSNLLKTGAVYTVLHRIQLQG
jgi:2'-5' RNA ligase